MNGPNIAVNDEMKQEFFLEMARVSAEDFERAGLEWSALLEIGVHHTSQIGELAEVAASIANHLQRCREVHSVRWRIKDPFHLMKKILRKRLSSAGKYQDISVSNYREIVTDLMGVRALHLFKDDWAAVDQHVQDGWELGESVIAYVREGDSPALNKAYSERGFEVRVHDASYRSVHYIVCTQPRKDRLSVELQVRTIFEEAWSEIDHTLRYPDYSDNLLVGVFLQLFNRLAGSADEMGSFARLLTIELDRHTSEHARLETELKAEIDDLQKRVHELGRTKQPSEVARKLQEIDDRAAGMKANVPRYLTGGLESLNRAILGYGSSFENEFGKLQRQFLSQDRMIREILGTSKFNSIASSAAELERFRRLLPVGRDLRGSNEQPNGAAREPEGPARNHGAEDATADGNPAAGPLESNDAGSEDP